MARGHVNRTRNFREIEFWPQDGHVVMYNRAADTRRVFTVEKARQRAKEFYITAKNMDGSRRAEYMRAARRLLEAADYAEYQREVIRRRAVMFRTRSGILVPASAVQGTR